MPRVQTPARARGRAGWATTHGAVKTDAHRLIAQQQQQQTYDAIAMTMPRPEGPKARDETERGDQCGERERQSEARGS